MLAELRDARAVRAVLGQGVRVVSRRELQRRRSRRSVVVELADGSRFMLKYDWRAWRVAQESSRLAAANLLEGIDTPRLRGSTRHHLVQEFVPGDAFDSLAMRATGEARVALFLRAARVLAAIHGSRRAVPADFRLSEPCAPGRLAARVRRAWHEIEARGFPRWEARQGSVPAAWRRALGEQRIGQLVADLGAIGDACVLGHGDYQLRHLLRSADDRVVVVDWIAMALVTPWIELAHLLRWLAPAERDAVTAAYLEAMHRQGLLQETSNARSASLATSGLLYDHLIVAKQMVRKLGRACSPSQQRMFRVSLDALAEGIA